MPNARASVGMVDDHDSKSCGLRPWRFESSLAHLIIDNSSGHERNKKVSREMKRLI